MTRILIVEDDPDLAEGLADNLRFEEWTAEVAASGEAGLEALTAGSYELLLLDLMLPGISGFDLLRTQEQWQGRPRIIILSARDAEVDIVRGLDLGAHDYVKKPFGLAELLARIKAQLREVQDTAEPEERLAFGRAQVSLRRYRLWRDGEEQLLSHTEVGLVRLFLERPDMPLRRADIIGAVWGDDAYPTERTVDNFILKLRRKVEDDPARPQFLKTVHRVGYRYAPDGDA